jgi:hypothetical protein
MAAIMSSTEGRASRRPTFIAMNLAAFALLVGAGLVHGRLTDRWGISGALAEAVARLDRVPRSIGDWEGRDVAMDRRQIDRAGIQGFLSRSYRNVRDGREATVLLVCGRPGQIAVHTPDVCYRGAGYEPSSAPAPGTVGTGVDRPAEFLKARFCKTSAPVPDALDILWSWNARGAWEVPANPRLGFASYPALYKIYVIARRDGALAASPGDPAIDQEFAGLILTTIDRSLSMRDRSATTGTASTSRPLLAR